MKKLLITIISVIMAITMLSGCAKPLENVGGDVISGNGTFLVEKGDYVYFVNGKESVDASNKYGEVEKGALMRVKRTDLANPSQATPETVVSKVLISESYASGVYFYGDYVFYGTPSVRKDKKGNVLYTQTQFFKYDLTKGKEDSSHIAISKDDANEYAFIENDGEVYLVIVDTVTSGETTTKTLITYNAITKKQVGEGIKVNEIILPRDGSKTIYYTAFDYDEINEVDEAFQSIYSYTVGDENGVKILSGASVSKLPTDVQNAGNNYKGYTFSLIKNTGKYLVYLKTAIDTTSGGSNEYCYIDFGDSNKANKLVYKNKYSENAIKSTSYFGESLKDIYYVDSSSELSGLVKFDYTKLDDADMKNGRELISKDCANLTLQFVQDGYAYLVSSEGIYSRCKLVGGDGKAYQINAVAMASSTSWYNARVIGNYFIGSYTGDFYKNYVYVIDMTNIETPALEGEDKSAYQTNLEKLAIESRETVTALKATQIGVMTKSDSNYFNTTLDNKYPKEEE